MNKLLLIIILLITLLPQESFSQQGPPTLVETEPVVKLVFHEQISLAGRTEAITNSRIVAEVEGRVIDINAKEGNRVKATDKLITIDNRKSSLLFKSKAAETSQAKSIKTLAEGTLIRAQKLYRENLISDSSLDSVRAMTSIAVEKHLQLIADKKRLELDLNNCFVRAPYDGTTGRQLVNVGDWVKPGTPVFELADLSKIKVIVDLPEKYLGHLAIGSKADVSFTNNKKISSGGIVSGIAPISSGKSHTFPVIITIDNKDFQLASGMLARVTLYLNEEFESLAVSKDAIVRQGMNTLVYIIKDGLAKQITVSSKAFKDDMVAVSGEGLAENMPVIIRGNERIFPNSPVRTPGQNQEQNGSNEKEEKLAEKE